MAVDDTDYQWEYFKERMLESAAECLLWQAADVGRDGGDAFPAEEIETGRADAEDYLREAVEAFADAHKEILQDADARQAGHDFVLTVNGHGAGFWDGGWPEHGDELTEDAKPYGEFYAEFALWGDQADGDEHLSDELAWLMIGNEVTFHDDGFDPE